MTGIAADVAGKINADIPKLLADPEVKARFNTFAFKTITRSPGHPPRSAATPISRARARRTSS